MHIVNSADVEELTWSSPRGTFGGAGKQISEALGRKPQSTDLLERHPFDIEIQRLTPGQKVCPYHAHGLQWEFYHVIAGRGSVRHAEGTTPIGPGDAFLFKPGEAHQLVNDADDGDLIMYVVADNPLNEANYFPDSDKWMVGASPRRLIRSASLDYFDGEE